MNGLHEVFEAQVDARPDGTAIIFRDRRLTYGAVERQANQLARFLRARGAAPGRRVGLYIARSDRAIVAILGVLKTGATYVPLDPAFPADRCAYILQDAAVDLVITERALEGRLPTRGVPPTAVLDRPTTAAQIEALSADRHTATETGASPRDLAYIIYTSGTTGRPKGIMTEHRHVLAFLRAFQQVCHLQPSDRVYQGFSLAFDGSVEEMWLAFSCGAALVVGPPELATLGDETADYLVEHGVTVFSTVPTFLAMIRKDIPSLRLLEVSGEVCTPELVRRWARDGRRMLNVYGPTEATVNATVWECRPDVPVSIGRPLPGYAAFILDEQMQPVAAGKAGELYLGGPSVARGYLNQPELTRKHFVTNPFGTPGDGDRLYRTGDLVRQSADGDLFFLGRIDGQVKVRGFRIELEEIEAVLRDHPHVGAAAATVVERDGRAHLAAFVAPSPAGRAAFDRDGLLSLLRGRLPPYMVPGYLDVVDELPRLPSGKIDRRRLPAPATRLMGAGRDVVPPRTDLEHLLVATWERLFKTSPISIDADFFLDLGGDSLLAAALVSLLRADHGIECSMRDVYEHSTVAALAERVRAPAAGGIGEAPHPGDGEAAAESVVPRTLRRRRLACAALQALAAVGLSGFAAAPLLAFGLIVWWMIQGRLGPAAGTALLVAVVLGARPLMAAFTIALKWLVIGRYRPGAHPLWGWCYRRFWLVERAQALSGIGLLAGTPLMSLYYRLMGAKVGRGCIIDTPHCNAFDLVTIGDDTCVGAETHLLGWRAEQGLLRLGRVEIGRRCFVGIHSALGLNTRMGDDARLGDLSLLPDGVEQPSGSAWRGSPATPGGVPLPAIDEAVARRRRPARLGLRQYLLLGWLELMLLIPAVPGFAMIWAAFHAGRGAWVVAAVCLGVPVSVVAFCLWTAVLKALILRRARPGTYHVESSQAVRKWLADALMAATRTYAHAVYTTIYLPPWLRLLGARIGRWAEISTVSQVTPDLVDLGEGSFFADGSMIGGRHYFRGHMEFARSAVGRRSFVGNNALLPIGRHLGANCLLGVLSTPPEDHWSTPDGTEWLGAPSFRLLHRNPVAGFSEAVTYAPTRSLYVQRLAVDAVRILVPGFIAALGFLAFVAFLERAWPHLPPWAGYGLLPALSAIVSLGAGLCVVGLKWVIMGRFRPVIRPLWSAYVWWNEVVTGAWESVAAPALAPFLGTPFFPAFLRLMGCRVGRGTYIHTTLFSEFDLVNIGDGAVLNPGAVVQNHLFEDRIMKSSFLRIGDECAVGNMAVVLYDATMHTGAVVGPLSLLMKGEILPPRSRWIGIPVRRLEEEAD